MIALKKSFLYLCIVLSVGIVLLICFAYDEMGLSMEPDRSTATSSRSATTNQSAAGSLPTALFKVNPGCKQRSPVSSYRPITRARNYHHPSILHFAKFNGKDNEAKPLKFLEYMSMLSVYKIMKPEKIWVHSNGKINGKYWNLTQKWSGTAVEVIHTEKVTRLNRKKVRHFEHMADYTKLSQVLEHGGIAMDFDVIMINYTKLVKMQELSECVLVQEGTEIRISFFSCIKGAPFMRAMVDSYHKDYRPGWWWFNWVYNAGQVPTELLTKQRSDCFNVYVETEICEPNPLQVYAAWSKHNKVEWRKKTAAHYFKRYLYLPTENESILKESSSFSEMLNYIYNL